LPDEQFSNNARTTLSGAITNSATTIAVAAATGFPSTAQYRILIDAEVLLVTGGAGTTSWTVTRGVEGTTADPHGDGALVTHIITAASLKNVPDYVRKDTVTTKGDLLVATGSAALTRLAVGTNGQVLLADCAEATGVKWSGAGGLAGAAPDDAAYVTVAAHAGLSAEKVLGSEVLMSGPYASRPGAGTAGRLYLATDAPI
jgi:hypothetical protein